MKTSVRVDTLIESLRAQLERGGMTYAEAVVTEDFITVLEQARAKVTDDPEKTEALPKNRFTH